MKDILAVIEQRVHKINSIPYAKEPLRLAAILNRLDLLVRELTMMSGGSGIHDLLIDIAALCVAWVEFRRPPGARMEEKVQLGPTIGHA